MKTTSNRHFAGIPSLRNAIGLALFAALAFAQYVSAAVTINQHPQSVTIVSDDRATLTVDATGGAGLTYAWFRGESGNTTNPLPGANGPTYQTPPLKLSSSYWVRVTDADGSVASQTATVTVVTPAQMIETAITWLLGRQFADGSWNNNAADTAQVLLALFNAGYKEDAPGAQEQGPVTKGLAYMISQLQAQSVNIDGQSYDALTLGGGESTYYTGMCIMALVASRNSAYNDEIEKLRNWLLYAQTKASGNTYDGAFYYGVGGPGSGDLSNSQWGYFGLKAAGNVLKDGRSEVALDRAREGFLQNLQGSDGRGYYLPSYPSSFDRCMTSALVWSFALVGYGPEEQKVRNALEWLTTNYSWEYENARYYNLVTFSKALVMSHKTKLGNNNWYVDMCRYLLQNRSGDGSWYSGHWLDHTREINTAWAVLSMQTRTLARNLNPAMWITLRSYSDLHIYDPEGRHTGKNYDTNQLDNEIPGAKFILKLKDENGQPTGDPLPWPADGILLEEWAQIIQIDLTDAGTYRIELVGTGDGPWDLLLQGVENGVVVTSEEVSGNITDGTVLSTNVTVTALEGATTLLLEPIRSLPTLAVSPSILTIDPAVTTAQEFTLDVSEIGGNEDLLDVNIFPNFVGALVGATVNITPNDFDVTKGTTTEVTVTITLPHAIDLPTESGSIRIETAGGGSRTIKVSPEPEFSINPETATYQGEGGTGTVTVTAESVTDAEWKVTFANPADQTWVSITSGSSGIGSGVVNYAVAAGGAARTAILDIAGETFTITQQGSSVTTFEVDPDALEFDSEGGSQNVTITATPANSTATWVATAQGSPWISFTASSGQGSGTLVVNVAPFETTAPSRTGTITVAGNTITVTQNGVESLEDYFETLNSLGNSLYEAPGFGQFYGFEDMFWIYHLDHGWQYLDGPGGDLMWVYDLQLEWYFTNPAIYPFLWRARDTNWYYFVADQSEIGARHFYRFNGTVWEVYETIP